MDTRLISYILAMFCFDVERVNSFSDFNTIDKTRILPFIDYSKKEIRVNYSGSKLIRLPFEPDVMTNPSNNTEISEITELLNKTAIKLDEITTKLSGLILDNNTKEEKKNKEYKQVNKCLIIENKDLDVNVADKSNRNKINDAQFNTVLKNTTLVIK